MPPNKNAKCPCGSGRKYKQCCAKRRRGKRDRVERYSLEDRERALEHLHDFLLEHDDEDDNQRAWSMFLPEAAARDEIEDEGYELLDHLFDPWFAFDRSSKQGSTPVERFLDAEHLPNGQRLFMEQVSRARFSLHEVLGRGSSTLRLRDLLTGLERDVGNISMAHDARRGDLLAGRVLSRGRFGEPELEGLAITLPPRACTLVSSTLGRLWRSFDEHGDGKEQEAMLRHMPKLFAEFVFSDAGAPGPELRTVEGHEVSITEQYFHVSDLRALQLALDGLLELDPNHGDDYVGWSWLEPEPDDSGRGRLLGSLRLDGGELVLSTMSRERGERGRSLLETTVGPLVSHLRTEHQKAAQAIEGAMDAMAPPAGPGSGEVPLEVAAPILQEHFDRHYRRWLDDTIPALDGVTPRRAVRIAGLRPRVVELLRSFEASSSYARERGEFAYDFGWMWRELGLEDEW
jgi:hypothetical protein